MNNTHTSFKICTAISNCECACKCAFVRMLCVYICVYMCVHVCMVCVHACMVRAHVQVNACCAHVCKNGTA